MKKLRNNSDRASTLQIALSTGLIWISVILLAIAAPVKTEKASRKDHNGFPLKRGAHADSTTALGNYPDTSVSLSGDTTVTPDAAPTNTTSITVSTNTNFNGTFVASPTTGVVTVTDAHPAGIYSVTVVACGPGGTTTRSFALTVTGGMACGPNLIAGFTGMTDVSTGAVPHSVAIGDFNGDGKQDLAVANSGSTTVSIRLGNGLGSFSGLTEISVGSSPQSVAIGDFNGDGKQDLAVANQTYNTVSIRLGNGLGGFSGSTEINVGAQPWSVAIDDFNSDGKQDLVVVNYTSNTVSIRLGDGSGDFSGSTEINVGVQPLSVAVGDFNGDGKPDLAVANFGSDTVSIRLGDGSGGFSGSTEISVGSGPLSVAIGDFNGDGNQDLAVTNFDSSTVSIRLGNGSGGFGGSTEISVGSGPQSVAIGDFNGDGNQDLAVANYFSNTVSIRLGDGLGGFGSIPEVNVGSGPLSVAIGDFNGDGRQDLAVADYSSNTVSIRLGQCFPPLCPPVITQSSSQAITTGNSLSCNDGATHTDNSYWRAFDMAAYAGGCPYRIDSVSFGVEFANATQPVTVRLYTTSNFPAGYPGSLTQIGNSTLNVGTAQNGTVVTTPLVVTVPTGTPQLVMELFTPNGQPGGFRFFVGSNSALETGPSYFSAPACGITTPATTAASGAPNMHIVFDVNGTCLCPTPTPTATPTPTVCEIFRMTGRVTHCPSNAGLANVTITMSNEGSTTTIGGGTYLMFGHGCSFHTVTPSKVHLTSGAAGINTTDVLAVQRHFLAISLLTGCSLAAADVNGDTRVDTSDVIAIQRFFLGLTTGTGNVGKYNFTPASRSYSPPVDNQFDQNYDAIVLGDVASPFAGP